MISQNEFMDTGHILEQLSQPDYLGCVSEFKWPWAAVMLTMADELMREVHPISIKKRRPEYVETRPVGNGSVSTVHGESSNEVDK